MSDELSPHPFMPDDEGSGKYCRYMETGGRYYCNHSKFSEIHTDAPSLESNMALVARLNEEAEVLVEQTSSNTALVPVAGKNLPATVMKQQLVAARSALAAKRKEVQLAQQELKDQLEVRMREMSEIVGPLNEQLKRLEEGIWTVNLYLGRDEQIIALAEGAPAPADTPITIRQKVLFMDEETAISPEDGGIDAREIDQFDAWLLADPANLEQVLPEIRGVVAITPRRNNKDYGDPWINKQMGEANAKTYFLIRNGENVYRMVTEFEVGRRLVPARNEFTDLFYREEMNWDTHERERQPILPGTSDWLKAEKAQGERERHFMRVALILQGLCDRTAVFHPLPVEQLSLLSGAAYEAGYVKMLADDELELGTGRQPFYEWLTERNAQLRTGMRIIAAFDSDSFRRANYSEYDSDRRTSPNGVRYPESRVIHTLEGKRHGGFYFLYERTDQVWREMPVPGRPGYVRETLTTPARRASCIIYPTDKFILPIDLVTIEEMQEYLGARTDRHAYIDMFPLLKEAIAIKEREKEAERPFRTLLVGELIKAHGLQVDEVEETVSTLVDWWKLANRWHRPLVAAPEQEAKAIRMIVKEHGRRLAFHKPQKNDDAAMAEIRKHMPDVMMVARQSDGKYLALDAQPLDHPEQSIPRGIWVRQMTLTGTRLQASLIEPWVLVDNRQKHWYVVWSNEQWDEWNKLVRPGELLTGPDIDILHDTLLERHRHDNLHVAFTYSHRDRSAKLYSVDRDWDAGSIDVREDQGEVKYGYSTLKWTAVRGKMTPNAPDTYRSGGHQEWHGWPSHLRYNGENLPWDESEACWVDEAVLATVRERLVREREVTKARDRVWSAIREAENAVLSTLRERHVAAAFERFMEDYADASLWEDHRKTLKELNITVNLNKILVPLYYEGVDPTGMTVAEAVARAGLEYNTGAFSARYYSHHSPNQAEIDMIADVPLTWTSPASIEDGDDE